MLVRVGRRARSPAAVASSQLSPLLSNTFTVPGTDSERVRDVLEQHFGDRPDGSFTVVFRVPDARDPALVARLQRVVDRAARGRADAAGRRRCTSPSRHVVFGDVVSTLDLADAKGDTDDAARARSGSRRASSAPTSRAPAPIQHDLDPIFAEDLKKGECDRAADRARSSCSLVFGLSLAVTIPFIFAACTIMGTLGIVYGDRAPGRDADLRRRTSSS